MTFVVLNPRKARKLQLIFALKCFENRTVYAVTLAIVWLRDCKNEAAHFEPRWRLGERCRK